MELNLLNLQNIDVKIKGFIILGLFLFILSIYVNIYMVTFNLINNITNLIVTYVIYFTLNFLGLLIILLNLNYIITDYKNEIIKLQADNEILREDKKHLFRKLKVKELM